MSYCLPNLHEENFYLRSHDSEYNKSKSTQRTLLSEFVLKIDFDFGTFNTFYFTDENMRVYACFDELFWKSVCMVYIYIE